MKMKNLFSKKQFGKDNMSRLYLMSNFLISNCCRFDYHLIMN